MSMKSILTELSAALKEHKLAEGMTVSEDVVKAEIVRQIIYRKADLISVGLGLVGVEQFGNLDVKFQIPSDIDINYPVSEGARGTWGKVTWADFNMSLLKGEGAFMITDEAKIRGYDNIQYQTGIRRISEAFAVVKDHNILSTLIAAYGGNIDIGGASDKSAATIISGGIEAVLAAKGVTEADIPSIKVIIPYQDWSKIIKLQTVNNITISIKEWFRTAYGVQILPTKDATLAPTTGDRFGMVLVPGADTATHGTLRAPAGIPLVETKRHEGVGLEYIVRQFFGTKVLTDVEGGTTTVRIYRLEDTASMT